ncbi:MAG: S24 family peptidase, partial [Actinomycetota bacterium]|nr:S24 family peptidase [Actinomycetota bacterium]
AKKQSTANSGEIVVAGIPGEEATVKTYDKDGSDIILTPANSTMSPMRFSAGGHLDDEVLIFGKVVTVLRKI